MGLTLGFLGTGVITDAIVRAICKITSLDISIKVLARSTAISGKLAAEFPQVEVIADNQSLVDVSDFLVIALKRQIVPEELAKLQFKQEQVLISLVPTINRQRLAEYTRHPIDNIYRAVPLPFIAEHQSVTPIYPENTTLQQIFSQTGGVIVAADEKQFELFMMGGSMMGIYFKFADSCARWLFTQGLEEKQANIYISQLFHCLSQQTRLQESINFSKLQAEHSTPGGTNEMIARLFVEQGGAELLNHVFDDALTINQ